MAGQTRQDLFREGRGLFTSCQLAELSVSAAVATTVYGRVRVKEARRVGV